MTRRVAIIGAGPSGLAQLRAFQSAAEKGADVPEIVCFEKQSDWGGLWRYSWRTGVDEHGEPVHNSMYRYLWSNGPKECLEFADYSFDEHFGRPIGSYPPRAVLFDYIAGRAEKSDIRKYIRFSTAVRNVGYDDSTGKFTVTSLDLENNTQHSDEFDHVVVATGHFSVPNVPFYPGFDTYTGRLIHAHDFRDAAEFEGQDVMIMGASYSAEDIGSQCHKYGAKSVTTTSRAGGMGFDWPDTWEEKPIMTHVEGKTVHFVDGTSKEIDAIILCTGYLHHFPFMADDLKLRTGNLLWTDNLYMGVAWEDNPALFYLGMQDQYYTFNMFDAQAWYVRDVIMGDIELPSKDEMAAHSAEWKARNDALETAYDEIWYQGDYTQMLLEQTDYPDFSTEMVNQMFKVWKGHKGESIMGYRDKGFESPVTGTVAPSHHTTWLEALDDSLEDFMRT